MAFSIAGGGGRGAVDISTIRRWLVKRAQRFIKAGEISSNYWTGVRGPMNLSRTIIVHSIPVLFSFGGRDLHIIHYSFVHPPHLFVPHNLSNNRVLILSPAFPPQTTSSSSNLLLFHPFSSIRSIRWSKNFPFVESLSKSPDSPPIPMESFHRYLSNPNRPEYAPNFDINLPNPNTETDRGTDRGVRDK